MPTVLDLSGSSNASGMLNGAIFTNVNASNFNGSGGNGVLRPFLSLHASPIEQGFNTTATNPVGINPSATMNNQHVSNPVVQLSSLPQVVVNGTVYYQFLLDANQSSSSPLISLDELRFYVTTPTTPDPTALNQYDGTSFKLLDSNTPSFTGLSPVYDLQTGAVPADSNAVIISTLFTVTGTGRPTMYVDVPASLFGTDKSQFVYLYSKFGVRNEANAGAESWSVTTNGLPAQLSGQTATVIHNANGDTPISGAVTAGTIVHDTSTVTVPGGIPTGFPAPSGTVTYYFYATAAPIFGTTTPLTTQQVTISGGTVPNSPDTSALAAGSYSYIAVYNGDSVYAGSVSPIEPLTVTPASPAIHTTQQPASASVGKSIADTATVTGGFNPTGTVTFNLYNNPNGTGPALFTDTETLVNGSATSASFTTTTVGTVYWVATYNGDANNHAESSGLAAEPVTVVAAPTVTTLQSSTTAVVNSTAIHDTAIVSGGITPYDPNATVTFNLFDNPNGTGTPLFTDANETLINGRAISTSFTPTTVGTVFWVATFNDPSGTNPTESSDPAAEPVTVVPAPVVSTQQSATAVAVGTSIQDTATVSGGSTPYDPNATVTFNLFNNPNGTGPALFTDTEILVNGTATSASFTTTTVGTVYWVATFNGDSHNPTVSSDPAAEPVTVIPPPPPIPPAADVMLTKMVSPTNPIFGTPVTYTLIAHNNGPDTATNVVATDILPTGVMFVSATPSQGSFDPGSGTWIIGTLPNGASATLQITCIVTTIGPITNTASVEAPEPDPNPSNNTSTVTIDGMFAPGQISKSLFLSSSDAPLNPATLAAEEAMFNALVPMWTNLWDALLSEAQNMLAAGSGPGNGGIAVFEGSWLGSPLVVYANPFAGQVTAVQMGTFDFLYEDNAVDGVRLL